MVDIHYVRQKEPKGLGHAIYCARTFIGDEPFAVLLGDDVIYSKRSVIGQMIDVFEKREEPVIGVQQVPEKEVSKYGIVKYDRQEEDIYHIEDLIEKPDIDKAPSNLAILGRYVITPDIFPILARTKPGRNNEIQLTDALRELASERNMVAYNFSGKRYDVGNKMGFLQATVEYALRREDLGDEFFKYLVNLMEQEAEKRGHSTIVNSRTG